MLCDCSSAANLNRNDYKSESLSDNLQLRMPGPNDISTQDSEAFIRESSRAEHMVDNHDSFYGEDLSPSTLQELVLSRKSEHSCIIKKVRKACPDSDRYETVTKCSETSLTACHGAIPHYGSKKCMEVKTYIPNCGTIVTDCLCASRS